MRKYALEKEDEAARLEKMSDLPTYQISEEIVGFPIQAGQRVLDAGCGSGVVARYLAKTFPGIQAEGCDLPARIEQIRDLPQNRGRKDVSFFPSPVEKIQQPDGTYDRILCRYVFEFLEDPSRAVSEFLRVLKPGGRLLVIQFDGFLYNYEQKNPELRAMMETLKAKFPFDMYLGRKVPGLLKQAGFSKIEWDVQAHGIRGDRVEGEREHMYARFSNATEWYARALGSIEKAHRFRDLYCDEMDDPGNVLFYNKFLIRGTKPV
ncbi:MAG TPA: methyltransferase domain-containing protein [Bdellovibrionota bacterium]|jgi:ubiquinone/menaquinone biosynthesis C-methylase UbiE|nr:methyltransferase domain-containing protein [Bdellovibrionota bacterium]